MTAQEIYDQLLTMGYCKHFLDWFKIREITLPILKKNLLEEDDGF